MAEPLSGMQMTNDEWRDSIAYSGQIHYHTAQLDRLLRNGDTITIMKIPHQ